MLRPVADDEKEHMRLVQLRTEAVDDERNPLWLAEISTNNHFIYCLLVTFLSNSKIKETPQDRTDSTFGKETPQTNGKLAAAFWETAPEHLEYAAACCSDVQPSNPPALGLLFHILTQDLETKTNNHLDHLNEAASPNDFLMPSNLSMFERCHLPDAWPKNLRSSGM